MAFFAILITIFMKTVTRFAPSPTGYVHVGAIRTALFSWLLAQQADGKFIFRIEDTDKSREVDGAEEHIMASLKWLNLNWDEGPDIGGPQAPYKQSQRLVIYTEQAKKLLEQGKAYVDPYTPEQVQQFREDAKKAKKPFLFRNHRPEILDTNWDGTKPVRLKSDPKSYSWTDAVLGELSAGPEVIDDIVLVKADGYPTYNFCHIIDDDLMGVTHVIRSQEFTSSVPKFLNLYEAIDIKPPILATLPYVMAMEGNKKLSKRDGAKDILQYAKDGYLPEAMLNFLASLGWNDGSEQEVFTRQELINKFKLAQVQKSPARFDEKRLLWLNGQWIRKTSLDDLYTRVEDFWPTSAKNANEEYKKEVLKLVQDRLKTLADLSNISNFLFEEPTINLDLISSNKKLKKLSSAELADLLTATISKLEQTDFNAGSIQQALNELLEQTGQKPMILFSLIRLATTWTAFSPDLAPSLELLGKQKTLARLKTTQQALTSQ